MKYQVKAGNIKYEAENAKSREDQRAPVAPTINFVPNQKHKDIGIA